MTATDELRRLLDERGVEHFDSTGGTYWGGSAPARDGLGSVYRFSAREGICGLNVHLLSVTPEQAIEATLGRGTCRQIKTEEGFIVCSECGAPQPEDYTVYYCWCCGRKVVDA